MNNKQERIKNLRGVLNDGRPKSKVEKLSIKRMLRDFREGHKRGLVWDEGEAQRAIAQFPLLRYWRGRFTGQCFNLGSWQAECIIAPLFGWKNADGTRRFRKAYIEIPRFNGKTTLAAGIAINLLIEDDEPGAQIAIIGITKDQAMLCFRDVRNIVRGSPIRWKFHRNFPTKKIKALTKEVRCDALKSRIFPLSSNSRTTTVGDLGLRHAIIDQFSAYKRADFFGIIEDAMRNERQSLTLGITTAGYNTSACRHTHEYAEKIFNGVFQNDAFFAYVTGIDEGDDWRDEETWYKANPNLGVCKEIEDIREQCGRAECDSTRENTFKRSHLNMWVN